MGNITAEARALLSAATPGPWADCREGTCRWAIVAPSKERGHTQRVGTVVHRDDASLIAAAPRLLAALCDEATAQRERAERAEREVGQLKPVAQHLLCYLSLRSEKRTDARFERQAGEMERDHYGAMVEALLEWADDSRPAEPRRG